MTRSIVIVLALLVLNVESALADEQYKTTIATAAASPVLLNECEASARDYAPSPQSSIPDFYFDLGVKFTNVSHLSLKDVEFGFTAYDAGGSVLSSIGLSVSQSAAAEVRMNPGAVVDLLGARGWQGNNRANGKDHIRCSVERVTFSDGSVWKNQSAVPTPAPHSTTVPIAIDEVDFSDNTALNVVSVGVTFTNGDARTAVAIRFAMTPYDAFGGSLYPVVQNADCIGTYSPGVRIKEGPKGCTAFNILALGKVISVHVRVVKVVFSNGTQWDAQQ